MVVDQICFTCSLYIGNGGMCDPCHTCDSFCKECDTYFCGERENGEDLCSGYKCFNCTKIDPNGCEDFIENIPPQK